MRFVQFERSKSNATPLYSSGSCDVEISDQIIRKLIVVFFSTSSAFIVDYNPAHAHFGLRSRSDSLIFFMIGSFCLTKFALIFPKIDQLDH